MKLNLVINSQFVDPHLGLVDTSIGMYILNIIVMSETEENLRLGMTELKMTFSGFSKFFVFGFGHSHMWVKQRQREKEKENWLTVYF